MGAASFARLRLLLVSGHRWGPESDRELDAEERTAQWRADMRTLVHQIEKQAYAGKNCTLTPTTALRAAKGLRRFISCPTREEIGKVLCNNKTCTDIPCRHRCMWQANQIMRLYNERVD